VYRSAPSDCQPICLSVSRSACSVSVSLSVSSSRRFISLPVCPPVCYPSCLPTCPLPSSRSGGCEIAALPSGATSADQPADGGSFLKDNESNPILQYRQRKFGVFVRGMENRIRNRKKE